MTTPLDARSRHLRRVVVRMLKAARRGHVGSAYSVIDVLRVLYDDVLRFDPANPKWPGRDRCILSKGHGCLALYAVLWFVLPDRPGGASAFDRLLGIVRDLAGDGGRRERRADDAPASDRSDRNPGEGPRDGWSPTRS